MSVVVHEISHGYAALRLGDTTAKDEGRLTINPIKHIDPFGTILLPLILFITGSPILIGWAKPVPYDPRRLQQPMSDAAKIAAAGPASNLLLAVIFTLFAHLAGYASGAAMGQLLALVVVVNIFLALFNLIPLPPLDGSKILYSWLAKQGEGGMGAVVWLERYGTWILLAVIAWGMTIVQLPALYLANLLLPGFLN